MLEGWHAHRRYVARHQRAYGAGARRRRRQRLRGPVHRPQRAAGDRPSRATPTSTSSSRRSPSSSPRSCPATGAWASRARVVAAASGWSPRPARSCARWPPTGWRKLLVVPVGFVADHVETLYDLDVVLRGEVEAAGMQLPAQPAAQRLAALHRGARRRGRRLPGPASGRAPAAPARAGRTTTAAAERGAMPATAAGRRRRGVRP